jgi:hypothetical protein
VPNDRIAPTRRGVLTWDIVLAAWVLACVVLGVWTASSIQRLEPVGDTLLVSSRALTETADGFDRIRNIPLIGGNIGDIGDRIRQIARSARESGVETRRSVDQLSVALPIAIVVVAVVPPLVAYLAVRRRWMHEIRVTEMARDSTPASPFEVAR